MSLLLLLIRHAAHGDVGQVLTGRGPERGLTAQGEAQAVALGERLASAPIGRVLSSPRERAQATAAAIAARHDLAVEDSDALDEIDFGDWTGRRFDALEAEPGWRAWNATRGLAATPAGDTMLAVQHRVRALVRGLGRQREGACVALVTHADVIRATVCDRLGLATDNWARLAVAPASVTRLAIGEASATLLGLNEGATPAWS